MKKIKSAIVGIDFNEQAQVNLELLSEMTFLKNVDLHFVHVSMMQPYSWAKDLNIPLYPEGEARVVIEHAVVEKLQELGEKYSPIGYSGTIRHVCLFSSNPRKEFAGFTEKTGAGLVILLAEKQRHLSLGSFINYQCHHGAAHVLVLRKMDEA
jgi:hypothetical protein